eukprot:CAMPEP_0113944802 /NCGR_PEP_ID=MMETSP1339-20121228/36892_1 /TAXON_ID=94617 /ORGANISM="Fibrocapsa japonica" /LENGTH=221 /DNA_ID=CAMNT_0000950121 /DNA_START=114 /DNA_END=779 /DNA_ORIENTATION=+ /assembly_acc=CAM_ASM_000762
MIQKLGILSSQALVTSGVNYVGARLISRAFSSPAAALVRHPLSVTGAVPPPLSPIPERECGGGVRSQAIDEFGQISLVPPSAASTDLDEVADADAEAKAMEDSANRLFAVIELGGTQYKITTGDLVYAERLYNSEGKVADIGTTMDTDKVLLVGGLESTAVGLPTVPNAKVTLRVEQQRQDEKIYIFKKRRRKNSKRKKGFRRQLTILRVVDITCEALRKC